MKVNVNLYAKSGKWKYGGVVDVDERHQLWTEAHKQDLIDKQEIVTDGTFAHYTVVVQHTENYEQEQSEYFCQHCWPIGTFAGMTKNNGVK